MKIIKMILKIKIENEKEIGKIYESKNKKEIEKKMKMKLKMKTVLP